MRVIYETPAYASRITTISREYKPATIVYNLSISGGIRDITFDADGINPAPAQTPFSCVLLKNSTIVTPETFHWEGYGLLGGSAVSTTYTPVCASAFTAADLVNQRRPPPRYTVAVSVPVLTSNSKQKEKPIR